MRQDGEGDYNTMSSGLSSKLLRENNTLGGSSFLERSFFLKIWCRFDRGSGIKKTVFVLKGVSTET